MGRYLMWTKGFTGMIFSSRPTRNPEKMEIVLFDQI
jgi:membrane-bound inhibitor of C-type lysozyme